MTIDFTPHCVRCSNISILIFSTHIIDEIDSTVYNLLLDILYRAKYSIFVRKRQVCIHWYLLSSFVVAAILKKCTREMLPGDNENYCKFIQ